MKTNKTLAQKLCLLGLESLLSYTAALLAALLGGKLFGLVGIVFFIPLMAVALQLVHERTARRLAEKHLAREDLIE